MHIHLLLRRIAKVPLGPTVILSGVTYVERERERERERKAFHIHAQYVHYIAIEEREYVHLKIQIAHVASHQSQVLSSEQTQNCCQPPYAYNGAATKKVPQIARSSEQVRLFQLQA